MKKIKTYYLPILTILFINLLLVSCDNDETVTEIQANEPELFNDFNLVDGSSSDEVKTVDPGVSVTFTIGRKSRDCGGIGICKVTKVKVTLRTSSDYEGMTFNAEEIDGQYYVILAHTSTLSSEFDSNFYVDEDIIDEESGIVIPANTYAFDSTVGDYGGYKVLLTN